MNRNQEALEKGSFRRLIWNLCVPTVVVMVVLVLYNMADVYFIGQTGDPNQIAAVSLCGPLFSILSGLGTLFGNGGCTSISLALGRRDGDRVRHITALCFWGSLGIGAAFLAAVLLFLKPICGVLGADEGTLGFTMDYLRVIAIGAPVVLFSNVFTNLVRADGSTRQSMFTNLLGTVTNLILDPVFILLLDWGVTGAALATVLGNVVSASYLVRYIRKNCPGWSLSPRSVTLEKDIALPVVTLGLPMAFSTILMSVSHMFSNNLMMGYGAVAMSAQSVAGKIGMMISMTVMGICMGMQPAISYNFAAENRERTREIIKKTGILAVAVGTVLSAVCFLLRDTLIMAFIDNEQVLRLGRVMLTATVMIGPFYGLYQLCNTYLQATGRAGYATVVSLLNKGIIYLPVLFLLHGVFGLYGIVCASPVTDALSIVAAALLCRLAVKRSAGRERTGEPDGETA